MIVTRKECLGGNRCTPQHEAEAWHCLIQHSGPSVADLTGMLAAQFDLHVARSYLYEASNPYRQDTHAHAQARLIVPITQLTSNYVLVDYLERRLGRVAIALPTERPDQRAEFEAGNRAVQEFAEALQRYSAALADGTVTEAELTDLERETHEAIQAELRLVEIARAKRRVVVAPFRREGSGS